MPPVRTFLSWDDFNNTANDPNGSFVTAGVPVSWMFSGVSGNITTTTNLVTGISTTGGPGPVDNTSAMDIDAAGTGSVTFGSPVTNIQFRVNDFENNLEVLRVRVFDQNNNLVSYTITRGSNVIVRAGSAASGDVTLGTAAGSGGSTSTSTAGSTLFSIPGPASRIQFDLTLNGGASVDITDIWFTACFAAGTMIRTASGEQPIETLKVGDLVMTLDEGPQPIRWIGGRSFDAQALTDRPNLRPIRIQADALGDGTPTADLVVSPQHRVLVRSSIVEHMFGFDEVLVAAKHLQDDHLDVGVSAQDTVEYHHMLFDRHHVVFSNGAATESLYLGDEVLKGLPSAGMSEIQEIFPELTMERGHPPDPVRQFVRAARARRLVQRHVRNHKPLISPAVDAAPAQKRPSISLEVAVSALAD